MIKNRINFMRGYSNKMDNVKNVIIDFETKLYKLYFGFKI